MRLEVSLITAEGRPKDLVVNARPEATLRQAFRSELTSHDRLFMGDRALDLDTRLGAGLVRSGAILSVGRAGPAPRWPLDQASLGVLSGPSAAELVPVVTRVLVGREAPAGLLVPHPSVSATNTWCTPTADGSLIVEDGPSRNGTWVDGHRLGPGERATISPGGRFVAGQVVLGWLPRCRPDGSATAGDDGDLLFNRVARYVTTEAPAQVGMPGRPAGAGRSSSAAQLVTGGAMLVAGGGAAVMFGKPIFAVIGAIGPVAMIGTSMAQQRSARREAASGQAAYRATQKRAVEAVRAAMKREEQLAWARAPDPLTWTLAALGPTSALWSTVATDPEAGLIRIGTADQPSGIVLTVPGDTAARAPDLVAAPVLLDLREHSVLGIAGPLESARGACRNVLHQLVQGRSPDDLVVYHLGAEAGLDEWSWLRWLPHVRSVDADVHTVSPGPEALRARIEELARLVDQRTQLQGFGYRDQLVLPEVIILLDGAGALRGRSNLVPIIQKGAAVGFRFIALDAVASRLPAEATARLVLDPARPSAGSLQVRGSADAKVTVDLLDRGTCEATARAIAPLRPLGGGLEGGVPTSVRFVELLGLRSATAASILAEWAGGDEGRAVLGVDEHGAQVAVNLRTDGPHALVAGTSGAGKSELLRTMLAGLALSASPADLALFLIDFKGGGAFGRLTDLPHVVGYADDLTIGGALANRLLDSLRAELDLRKQLFKDAGKVDGLAEYRQVRRSRTELPEVARLVLVIDEFAQLKEAQPDFVDGMVNVARVGRSLGVHLVLATQQPAGVVTPQIRDNANLRICLRVLDPGTSQDLVGTPLAATFPNRAKGRAVSLSGDGLPTVFQAAYVSAPVLQDEAAIPDPEVTTLPWEACGIRSRPPERAEEAPSGPTDLSMVVELLRSAASGAGIPTSRRPWQPPLPERVSVGSLLAASATLPWGVIPFAVEDRPREQRQLAVSLRLGGGNIGVVGGRGSGRSSALRAIAASLCQLTSPSECHLHVIDMAPTSVLQPLAALPHCGVVATRRQRRRVERLVARLRLLAQERSSLLTRRGVSSLTELRAADGVASPFVVLLIDGWDQLCQEFQGPAQVVRDELVLLAEEGPGLGIQLVVSGGKLVATTKLRSALDRLLCLPFEQRDDMRAFDIPTRTLPDELPPGRAHLATGAAVQIGLLAEDPSTDAQNAALRRLAAGLESPPDGSGPLGLDDLPTRISISQAGALAGGRAASGRIVVVGVGGDELAGRTVDLDRLGGPFVVAGPAGSGRTAALVTIATQLLAAGEPVFLWPGKPEDVDRFDGVSIVEVGCDPVTLTGAVVLVDDVGRLVDTDLLLTALVDDRNVRLVLAGEPRALGGFMGWRVNARRGAAGLLFSARPGEGDLIGCSVGPGDAFEADPGRALLGLSGRFELVQVPWAG